MLTKSYYYSFPPKIATSLGPVQAQQNTGPDLDPNSLALPWLFMKEFSEKS